MGLLQRLFGRKQDHEKWLAEHPGKESTKRAPEPVDEGEQARARAHMEEDLAEARARRESQ